MLEDQAARLRKIAQEREPVNPPKKDMRVIAVSSGKGGVGKSNLTLNLAIALAELGKRIVVLDGDLGLANIDVICGLTPKFTLEDVIKNRKTLADILVEGPKGIKILPGSSGELLANLDPVRLQMLIERLQFLEDLADILLIDTGAGISRHVTQLLEAADEVVVVATPEPTSLTDAYGLVKTLLGVRKEWEIGVLINRARSKDEANTTFTRLEAASQRFLEHRLKYLGFVYEDHFVTKSIMRQTPVVVAFPMVPASQCIKTVAAELIGFLNKTKAPGKGIHRLIQGLMVRFTNNAV